MLLIIHPVIRLKLEGDWGTFESMCKIEQKWIQNSPISVCGFTIESPRPSQSPDFDLIVWWFKRLKVQSVKCIKPLSPKGAPLSSIRVVSQVSHSIWKQETDPQNNRTMSVSPTRVCPSHRRCKTLKSSCIQLDVFTCLMFHEWK